MTHLCKNRFPKKLLPMIKEWCKKAPKGTLYSVKESDKVIVIEKVFDVCFAYKRKKY